MDFQKNKEGIAELQHCQITLKKNSFDIIICLILGKV